MPHPENGNGTNGDATPDERTHLLANSNGDSHPEQRPNGGIVHHPTHKPWGEDDPRPYVRWPLLVGYTTWMTLASNYVNVLLVFVPLGIIAGALDWNPTAVFVLVCLRNSAFSAVEGLLTAAHRTSSPSSRLRRC